MPYEPIEYDCGKGVSIRRCPKGSDTQPEFWYIKKGCGRGCSYWTEEGWSGVFPMQFNTAQEAIDYHKENADKINAL